MSRGLRIGPLPPVRRKRPPRRPPTRPPQQLRLPPYHVYTILAWTDAHHRRSGRWPSLNSGEIPEAPGETWRKVDGALRNGCRGMPAGSSLAKFLMRHGRRPFRQVQRHPARHARLTVAQILAWSDEFYRRNGRWPGLFAGRIAGTHDETWQCINQSLRAGTRGLPGGSSLALLLEQWRGRRHGWHLPRFSVRGILAWADAYNRRHGAYPGLHSGAILEAPGETWQKVENALRNGSRGLPGNETLAQLLVRYRRRPPLSYRWRPPRQARLTVAQILEWADAFHRRHGAWPAVLSGRIAGARDETWQCVDDALRHGLRGLAGGSSLALLLQRRRGAHFKQHSAPLTIRGILGWADAHRRRTGRWPTVRSGRIREASTDTWLAVYTALYGGGRGLPGGDSLWRLLRRERGAVKGK